jgi:hypothetical protein
VAKKANTSTNKILEVILKNFLNPNTSYSSNLPIFLPRKNIEIAPGPV